jgi:cytochrome P450
MGLVAQFQERCNNVVQSIIEEQKSEAFEKVKSTSSKPTFFHDVLNSDLPPEEKKPTRLAREVQVPIGAGGETMAKMLAWTIYYLLESPEKMKKLKEELSRLDPSGTATLIDYERMSYLVSATSL